MSSVLRVNKLRVEYGAGEHAVRAVDDVSFSINHGETLALVGESGCGKSSVARAVMRLETPTSGSVQLDDLDIARLPERKLKSKRKNFQMIFQDPLSSLNPKRKIRDILEAPLRVNKLYNQDSEKLIQTTLEKVGIDAAHALHRYPHEFSGGQCQRISIARALLLSPSILVCDEPVSALDVSVRAQVLNVLNDLRESLGLTMLFISHDLAVVRNVADRVAVMYLGAICEIGEADAIFNQTAHPYTAALLSAVPAAHDQTASKRIRLIGEMPSPMNLPTGCRFRSRCPAAQELCAKKAPPVQSITADHAVACHFPIFISAANPTLIN